MSEKEPKKKTPRKAAVKKTAVKADGLKAPKKAAVKKTAVKAEAAPEKTEPKKTRAKKTALPKKIKETVVPVEHKIEESAEESKIEAAKFYPPQISVKSDVKKQVQAPVKERQEQDIPSRYYDDKIVLMARDPYWCYAYWDISAALMEKKTEEAKKSGAYKLILRIYDVTDIIFNGNNAHKSADVEVTGDANNWYINVWEAGRTYVADLGFRTADGKFIMIARSNTVGTPRDRVSDKVDEEFMEVGEDFDEIMKLSGAGNNGAFLGGSEGLGRVNVSGMTSDTVSSFSSPAYKLEKEKGFFLWADTELILYGATEKDAKLKVKGEVIQLKPDGSFSLRFHLPDGTIELPIEAESADGLDKKSIKINVNRKTE